MPSHQKLHRFCINLSDPNVLITRVLFFPFTRIVFTALYVIEDLFFVHPSLIADFSDDLKQAVKMLLDRNIGYDFSFTA